MDDLISRQAAIDALTPYDDDYRIRDVLEDLPSAQPGWKRGQWLDGYKRQTCSLCKGRGVRSWNYCPYCGADMREVDDERPD